LANFDAYPATPRRPSSGCRRRFRHHVSMTANAMVQATAIATMNHTSRFVSASIAWHPSSRRRPPPRSQCSWLTTAKAMVQTATKANVTAVAIAMTRKSWRVWLSIAPFRPYPPPAAPATAPALVEKRPQPRGVGRDRSLSFMLEALKRATKQIVPRGPQRAAQICILFRKPVGSIRVEYAGAPPAGRRVDG
jgi:hypothetical protein